METNDQYALTVLQLLNKSIVYELLSCNVLKMCDVQL